MKEVEGELVQSLEKVVLTFLLRSKGYEVEGYKIDGVAGLQGQQTFKPTMIMQL